VEAWISNPCNTEFAQGQRTGQDAALWAGYREYIRLKQFKKRKWVQIKSEREEIERLKETNTG